MTLHITQEIIASSCRSNARRCLLANAATVALETEVVCDGRNLYTVNRRQHFPLTEEAIRLVLDWDSGLNVEPQTIEI